MERQYLDEIKKKLRESGKPIIDLSDKDRTVLYKLVGEAWLNTAELESLSKYDWPKVAIMEIVRASTKEVLPPCNNVNIKALLRKNKIILSDIVFFCIGCGSLQPYKAVESSYFIEHQEDFWFFGDDLAFYDESFAWEMEVGDDGQVTLAKRALPQN